MQSFLFSPELFECRSQLMSAFESADLLMFRDYAAIDLDHDNYGLDVTGIKNENDSVKMLLILYDVFPSWRYGDRVYDDSPVEPGWRILICKKGQRRLSERFSSEDDFDSDDDDDWEIGFDDE